MTGHHSDGWGLAFFENNQLHLITDIQSAVSSPKASMVRKLAIKSTNALAHIRKATQGAVEIKNCHPFSRQLWGQTWVFGHNGNLQKPASPLLTHFHPEGETDSELAFCIILNKLAAEFGANYPDTHALIESLKTITAEIAATGEFNYLLTNGKLTIAHCSTKLFYAEHKCHAQHDYLTKALPHTSGATRLANCMTMIATTPMSVDEHWVAMKPNELVAFQDGIKI